RPDRRRHHRHPRPQLLVHRPGHADPGRAPDHLSQIAAQQPADQRLLRPARVHGVRPRRLGRPLMPWGSQWGSLGATQVGSLKVAAGDPGIDTSAAGILALGGANATKVDVDPDLLFSSHLISDAAGTPATSNLGANVTSATFTGNDTRGTIAIVMAGALAANT